MLLYAATILVSSFLLFLVQPIIAKQILPWFGGSAAVWTTCLLFFQLALLAGYAYSDFSSRLKPRTQTGIHIVLLVASLVSLPIVAGLGWKPAGDEDPIFRILGLLAATIGLPYFMLSTTGPLVQSWFAREHADPAVAKRVYRLFALSNFGSLVGLLAYPFAIEMWVSTRVQARGWSGAYALFVLLCAACAWRARKTEAGSVLPAQDASGVTRAAPDVSQAPPGPADYALWLILAALASLLLLSISNHIVQNVASIPFLWVLPLTLYLLTFVLCFEGRGGRGWYVRKFWLLPVLVILGGMAWGLTAQSGVLHIDQAVPLYCGGLFLACMFCHGELAHAKPAPRYLTRFYLMLSLGGAIGGMFVGLAAPKLFNSYWELPLGLTACAAMAFAVTAGPIARRLTGFVPVVALLVTAACAYYVSINQAWLNQGRLINTTWDLPLEIALCALLVYGLAARLTGKVLATIAPVAALVASGVCAYHALAYDKFMKSDTILARRNFYGALRVKQPLPDNDPQAQRRLMHGVIMHGEQYVAPESRGIITSYYGESSGIGMALARIHPVEQTVGMIGMGAGTLAAYGQKGDRFRIYEINPQVIDIATHYFYYLTESHAKVETALGDARLVLEREASRQFDVLAVDAFSSDAIPVHLITREALKVYLKHIKPEGAIAFHVTNRYLRLAPVVKLLADEVGMESVLITDDPDDPDLSRTDWVIVTRNREFLADPDVAKKRIVIEPIPGLLPWSDDFNNLFRILK